MSKNIVNINGYKFSVIFLHLKIKIYPMGIFPQRYRQMKRQKLQWLVLVDLKLNKSQNINCWWIKLDHRLKHFLKKKHLCFLENAERKMTWPLVLLIISLIKKGHWFSASHLLYILRTYKLLRGFQPTFLSDIQNFYARSFSDDALRHRILLFGTASGIRMHQVFCVIQQFVQPSIFLSLETLSSSAVPSENEKCMEVFKNKDRKICASIFSPVIHSGI